MSRAIDGDLSPDDADRLEQCLAADPEARAEFEKMKRLNDLVGHWGKQAAPVDDSQAGALIGERIQQDAEFAISQVLDGDEQAEQKLVAYARRDPNLGLVEHRYRRMTGLLAAWGQIEPPVDHDRLFERLRKTIRAEAGQEAARAPRIIRLYAPLAAAASLMIVAGLWWMGRGDAPLTTVGPPEIEVALAGPPSPAPQAKPVMEFSFGLVRDAPVQSLASASAGDGSGIVISIGGLQASAKNAPQQQQETLF